MHLLTVLLLVCVAAVQPQHVPLKIAIESDEADADPLAVCSDQIVAAKIDALVPPTNSAAATVLISLQLDDMQLPGAVLFSAAGYTISLRANGENMHRASQAGDLTACRRSCRTGVQEPAPTSRTLEWYLCTHALSLGCNISCRGDDTIHCNWQH